VRKQFSEQADIQIHFQPFQLYPELPVGNNEGVDKTLFFDEMRKRRGDTVSASSSEQRAKSRQGLKEAWAKDGLSLNLGQGGRWGNSVDAQRLIMHAREQDREDAMIEGIYAANHENNQPLSDWSILLTAAEQAGVTDAEEMLKSDWGKAEHAAKVQRYVDMGITSVPVVVLNDTYPLHGAPDKGLLAHYFTQLIENDKIDTTYSGCPGDYAVIFESGLGSLLNMPAEAKQHVERTLIEQGETNGLETLAHVLVEDSFGHFGTQNLTQDQKQEIAEYLINDSAFMHKFKQTMLEVVA